MAVTEQFKLTIEYADAEKLSKLLLECTGLLNEFAAYAKQHSGEFYSEVEVTVGGVMADIGWELLERIFRQHPSLRPYTLQNDNGSD